MYLDGINSHAPVLVFDNDVVEPYLITDDGTVGGPEDGFSEVVGIPLVFVGFVVGIAGFGLEVGFEELLVDVEGGTNSSFFTEDGIPVDVDIEGVFGRMSRPVELEDVFGDAPCHPWGYGGIGIDEFVGTDADGGKGITGMDEVEAGGWSEVVFPVPGTSGRLIGQGDQGRECFGIGC